MSSVYVMLSCTFRYGRQDMDVMGVAFRRDLFLVTRQVYPELQDKEKLTHTKIQQKLLRKLGDNAFPFFFEVRKKQNQLSVLSMGSGLSYRQSQSLDIFLLQIPLTDPNSYASSDVVVLSSLDLERKGYANNSSGEPIN